MKIVITGGAGFIGSHVNAIARAVGHEVVILDRVGAPGVDLAICAPSHFAGAEAVIHCAAHADVRNNWTPGSLSALWLDNMLSTRRMLECLAITPTLRALVFVSTGAAYAGTRHDADELDAVTATSPYAATKLAGEAFVQAYAERHGWRWYAPRLAACFGAGYHHGHVADFVRMAKRTGHVHALDTGARKRDAVHVRDAADALLAMATEEKPSGVYNVVAEEGWSWRETVRLMGVPFTHDERPWGWIGDGKGGRMRGTKLKAIGLAPTRPVEHGVVEALASLGWQRKTEAAE